MKNIISASRRTDIPAFYLDWLKHCLRKGYAELITPNGKLTRVDLRKEGIHTIVLWSKNFHQFLKNYREFKEYHLFFNFTINDCKILEPNIPELEERLSQLKKLASLFGPERINWRFDPIIFWDEGKENNIKSFKKIAKEAAKAGIKRCYFSFCTYYKKVISRLKQVNFKYYEPGIDEKIELTIKLSNFSRNLGISMYSCCDKELLKVENVNPASCIDGELLEKVSGVSLLSKEKDSSQRKECNCTKSIDIGSYSLRCRHSCLYCYANPQKISSLNLPAI
jgi:DNA repair photolyase